MWKFCLVVMCPVVVLFDNGENKVHWHRCEEGLHIIGCDVFSDVVYKVLSVMDVMG